MAVGDYIGGLTVLDDDPRPTLTVVPVATDVREGEDLVWRLQLSDVTDVGVFVQLIAEAPGGESSCRGGHTRPVGRLVAGARSRPVRSGRACSPTPSPFVFAYIEPGTDRIDIVVPTCKDSRVEGTESLALVLDEVSSAELADPSARLVGRIRDRT